MILRREKRFRRESAATSFLRQKHVQDSSTDPHFYFQRQDRQREHRYPNAVGGASALIVVDWQYGHGMV